MRETRITQWIAAGLITVAATLIALKWLVAGITPGRPIPPLWHIHARMSFRSTGPHSGVRLLLPRGGDGHSIVSEHLRDDGMPRLQSVVATSRNRVVSWRETRADESHVTGYSAWLDTAQQTNAERAPTAARLEKLSRPTRMIQSDDPAIWAEAERVVQAGQGAGRIAAIAEFVRNEIRVLPDGSAVSAVRCLRTKEGSPRSLSRLACALLRSQGIPCQIVGGLRLEEDVRTHASYWVEAWDGNRWVTLCPETGEVGSRPPDQLPIFRGDYSLARFRDCEDADILVTVERKLAPAHVQAQLARRSASLFDRLSLASLPADTQQLVGLLLMLPVGALLIACFRNLIGLSTFGIFTPILLALAFREMQLGWGIFYLTMLVGTGVLARWVLERLKLLMVPRLATVLSLVIGLMIGLIFLGSRWGIHSALSVGLFPMVIMTNAVERFFVLQSEDGTANALKESLTTLLAASCGFVLFQWDWLRDVLFTYPELLLIDVGLLLLLGRYSGYRLMELWRFRSLARVPA